MSLDTYREEMDEINYELIQLMSRRLKLARKIAIYKGEHELPILDEKREREQSEQIRRLAEEEGLSPELTLQLFASLVEYCRKEMQKEI